MFKKKDTGNDYKEKIITIVEEQLVTAYSSLEMTTDRELYNETLGHIECLEKLLAKYKTKPKQKLELDWTKIILGTMSVGTTVGTTMMVINNERHGSILPPWAQNTVVRKSLNGDID